MIPKDDEAQIVRLHLIEKWPPGTIARHLKLHHGVVRRVLTRVGVPASTISHRRSIADPYAGFIVETLTKYPDLCASRLHEMVRERGYPGSGAHFRSVVTARVSPRRRFCACARSLANRSRWIGACSARSPCPAGSGRSSRS
jgi:hypothetical protein